MTMKHPPEYYLEKMHCPLAFVKIPPVLDKDDFWLKLSSNDAEALQWMIATGVYDSFEKNFAEWEEDNSFGDFIIVAKAKWDKKKRTGTMYIFSCSLLEGDSGIMTFIIPDYWDHEDEANDIIVGLAKQIKAKVFNVKPEGIING
tara:strand:- start:345 stop:779 length:435 start_codon:yes stop_codon:yes gene_type:complete